MTLSLCRCLCELWYLQHPLYLSRSRATERRLWDLGITVAIVQYEATSMRLLHLLGDLRLRGPLRGGHSHRPHEVWHAWRTPPRGPTLYWLAEYPDWHMKNLKAMAMPLGGGVLLKPLPGMPGRVELDLKLFADLSLLDRPPQVADPRRARPGEPLNVPPRRGCRDGPLAMSPGACVRPMPAAWWQLFTSAVPALLPP